MNKNIFLSLLLIVVAAINGKTIAQTYKVLVFENFGTGTANPNATPATLVAPGTTDYTPLTTLTTLRDGSYATAKNPQGFDNFGNITNAWQHGGDHTTGLEYMMMINANPAKQGEANGSYYLYSSSAFDIPGAEYAIDFWGANLIRYNMTTTNPGLTFKDGFIGLAVRNTPNATGTLYNTTGTNQWILPRATGTQNTIPWVNRAVTFVLPTTYNSPALYFNFYNSDNNPSTFGNDLAIDDITIKMRVITVSGKVFNDLNGNNIIDGEPGYNGIAAPLFVYLTKADGTIISKAQVQADGTYTFANDQGVPYVSANIGLKLAVSGTDLALGGNVSSATLPSGYVSTGENVNGASGASAGVTDGIINFTSSTTDKVNLNFGIEQQPTAGGGANSILNPGGTAQLTVAASTFTNTTNSTDPAPGAVTSLRITAFPTGATTIVINGTSYTPATFPAGGVVVPANAAGQPTQTITVDPSSNNTGSVSIPFKAIDAAGKESANTGTAVINVLALTVSGTVLNDNNGQTGGVNGTAVSGVTVTLYAPNGSTVLATTTTDASGNYSFPNQVVPGNYVVGVTPLAGYNNVSASDGVTPADGKSAIIVASTNLTGVNFGINQPPVANNNNLSGQLPGIAATIPNILGNDTDPNGGTLAANEISLIAPAGATGVITDAQGDVTGFTVPGQGSWGLNSSTGAVTFTPQLLFLGSPTAIQYTVTDAAGLTSNAATLSISTLLSTSVGGTVYNDNNAGTPDGTASPVTTVNLKNSSGVIVATTTTDGTGNYTFPGIVVGNYTVEIVTPAGFQNVGSTDAATPANGSTPITVGAAPVTGVNFGINQPPVASNDAIAGQVPGTVAIVPNILANDTDPNGGTLAANEISLIAPAGAAGVITDAQGDVTGFTVPGQGSWGLNSSTGAVTFTPQAGFTGDPTPITYTVTDAAGLESNTATISIDYLPQFSVSGSVFNDANGPTDNIVNGAGTNTGGLNAVLVDPVSGNVVATVPVAADGSYTLTGINGGSYNLLITTNTATVGGQAPAIVLPAGWVSTGEGTTTAGDGTPNGTTPVSVTGDVTAANFGIEREPTSDPKTGTLAVQPNSGQFVTLDGTVVTAPALTGADPEDQPTSGTLAGKSVAITSLPTNGELWYNNVQITFGADNTTPPSPTNPFIIPALDPALLQIKLTGTGYTTTTFNYAYIDAAGIQDPTPAPYTLSWEKPLPVTLVSFKGSVSETTVILRWTTSTEVNAARFDIERSPDAKAKTWAKIDQVATAGDERSTKLYQYTDLFPLKGTNYYRLKMVDLDETYTYSQIISLGLAEAVEIVLYPNPGKEKLFLKGVNWVHVKSVQLANPAGVTVYRSGPAVNGIDISGLAPGVYILTLTDTNNQAKAFRLIKQ